MDTTPDLFRKDLQVDKFPPPREFQRIAHEKLREGMRQKKRRQILVAATGSGKTYCAMRLVSECLKKGKRALFVCDRTALINQTSAVADQYGLTNHAVIQAEHPRRDSTMPFQIASLQTLAARKYWPEADLIIIDECFPAGTPVLTPNGFRNIEDIQSGDSVMSALGPDAVESVFTKRSSVIRVRLSNGISIKCTADHPVFTTSGWIAAAKLARGQRLLGLQDMRALWSGISPKEVPITDGSIGNGKLVLSAQSLLEILLMECSQSDEIGKINRQNARDIRQNWTSAEGARRERAPNAACTSATVGGARQRLGAGIHRADTQRAREWLSDTLQDRPCQSQFTRSVGTRWVQSLRALASNAGCEEGCASQRIWVESVETEECSSSVPVFNLRVRNHPSYFAHGVLVHNCHTLYSAWTEHVMRTSAAVVGLTATPFTKGLGKIFENVVNAATMHSLTEQGVLVPMRILSCVKPDMAGAQTSGGEWTARAASEREMTILGDVVAEWVKHGENRKTIAFGSDIAYVTELVQKFNQAGVGAACYTSMTPDQERIELLREFSKPDPSIKILASVAALAKGFDVKDIGCVIDARPLRKSLSEVIQMWGRGLRASPETGKKDLLLLDHSGNACRFYNDFLDIYFNGCGALDMAEKYDSTPRKDDEDFQAAGCPKCKHKPFKRRCLACGYEKETQAVTDASPGVMKPLPVMIGSKKAAKDKDDAWAQICSYARIYLKTEKKPGWAYFKYRDIVGEKPSRNMNFESAPDVPISAAMMGKIRAMTIAFARRRKPESA